MSNPVSSPIYCVMCIDKPNSESLRLENRQAHLEYVVSQGVGVGVGGPLISEDGETMIGTMLLLNVKDHATAAAFVENDPYNKAGLFEKIEIHRWKHLIGGLDAPQS